MKEKELEKHLDMSYANILTTIGNILELYGIDKNILKYKLDSGDVLQTELDTYLMRIIADVNYVTIIMKGLKNEKFNQKK